MVYLIFQCARRVGTAAMAAVCNNAHPGLTRSRTTGRTADPARFAPYVITCVCLAKGLMRRTVSPVMRIRSSHGTTALCSAYWTGSRGRCNTQCGSTGWPWHSWWIFASWSPSSSVWRSIGTSADARPLTNIVKCRIPAMAKHTRTRSNCRETSVSPTANKPLNDEIWKHHPEGKSYCRTSHESIPENVSWGYSQR